MLQFDCSVGRSPRMKQTQQIALLIPLTVGLCTLASTIVIHALVLNVAIRFVRWERRRGRAGKSFRIDLPIVGLTTSFALGHWNK